MAHDIIASLTDLVKAPEQGTLFTAVIHKVGCTRGPSGSPVTYGDDTKRVLIWTGFEYRTLVARSMKALDHQMGRGRYIEQIARATLQERPDTTIADVCQALQEVREGFRLKMHSPDTSWNTEIVPPSPGVWSPLRIQGVTVKGCMVYQGPPEIQGVDLKRQGDPQKGQIYIRGAKLGEQVIQSAPNGAWKAKSSPKTIAKGIIKEGLPIGLYCQYRLDPERVRDVAVGAEAAEVAREHQIPIDPRHLLSLV